jgi:hypothetical protein
MLEVAICTSCYLGYHDECMTPVEREDGLFDCCCSLAEPEVARASGETLGLVGRPLKPLDEIKDKTSAGRKRAATIAPIFPGMECEWAGLRNAGGGVQPIVGCRGNLIQEKNGTDPDYFQGDRHHGPNKSTLENTPGINLHRICAECHHRWHALNDRYYSRERPPADEPWYPEGDWEKHDGLTEATEEELDASEAYWALTPEDRARTDYPIQRR